MRDLYEKNETAFALAWIFISIAGTGLAGTLGGAAGVRWLVPAVYHTVMAAVLLRWVRRNGLTEKYGLFLPRYRPASAWFYLPLAAVALYRLPFFEPPLRISAGGVLFAVSMMCAGFQEELVFRGFLFRAVEKGNPARAVIISAFVFGAGHLANLLNGQGLAETACQFVFAVAAGAAMAVLFYRGKSLVPCIVFHGVFNSLSAAGNEEAVYHALGGPAAARVILTAAGAAVLAGYSVRNWKRLDG